MVAIKTAHLASRFLFGIRHKRILECNRDHTLLLYLPVGNRPLRRRRCRQRWHCSPIKSQMNRKFLRDQPGYFKLLRITLQYHYCPLWVFPLTCGGGDALEMMFYVGALMLSSFMTAASRLTAGGSQCQMPDGSFWFACAAVGPDQWWSRSIVLASLSSK